MGKKGNIETNDWIRLELEMMRAENKYLREQNDEIIRLLRAGHSMPATAEKTYTPEEAKIILKISTRTLLKLKQTGKIRFIKNNGKILYLQSDLDDYLRSNSHRAIQPPSTRRTSA
jgi:hypothetical protein